MNYFIYSIDGTIIPIETAFIIDAEHLSEHDKEVLDTGGLLSLDVVEHIGIGVTELLTQLKK
jgi:hypothetical protein